MKAKSDLSLAQVQIRIQNLCVACLRHQQLSGKAMTFKTQSNGYAIAH